MEWEVVHRRRLKAAVLARIPLPPKIERFGSFCGNWSQRGLFVLMTKEQAIAYIEDFTWSTTRLGLDRTRELLEKMGNPQKKLKFIHVAGSNGKGSTCAMLDSILRAAGYKTGLYTSPYIQDFCERMQINGKNIPDEELASITDHVRVYADTMEDHPSQFELVTAIAMEYFARNDVNIVVLEVGMGGLLDSTNVIDAPEAAIITNIGLEHTEYLGNTIAEIAANKAGIIKPGCSVVCYDGPDDAVRVVRETCHRNHVPLTMADLSQLHPISRSLDGQIFDYKDWKKVQLNLLGDYQLRNASVVLETVGVLRSRGWHLTEEQVREGMSHVSWPARFEILNRKPLFILDGGHNPQCAGALAESLRDLLPGRKVVFLTGVLADKDYKDMMKVVLPYAQEFVTLTPLNERALPAEKLADYISSLGVPAAPAEDIASGLNLAMKKAGEDGIVVSFGSLYMAGAVRAKYHAAYRKWLRSSKIHTRDSIPPAEREKKSEAVVRQILKSPEFARARNVLIYEAVRGEVSLQSLKQPAAEQGKRIAYPLCISKTEMKAYVPKDESSWKDGAYHIPEPIPEKSEEMRPEEIDLAICPLTVFDEAAQRMGMGAGYYDRFLLKCTHADIIGVAFEAQKAEQVPADDWDKPMDAVYTEMRRYPDDLN